MNAEAMTERFEMRLSQSVLARLDAWRADQEDLPSRAEAVRRLVEQGLDASGGKKKVTLNDGDRLTLVMLCQLFKSLEVKSEIDPDFVESAIQGGHYWGLEWEYAGIFHGYEDHPSVVKEVIDILDMWYFLERGYNQLPKKEKDRVAEKAAPFGEYVRFSGFDGNHEAEYIGVARFLIEKLKRFVEFKGRDLNAHMPTIDLHRRMLAAFEPIRRKLMGRNVSAAEIIEILRAGVHPSQRSAVSL